MLTSRLLKLGGEITGTDWNYLSPDTVDIYLASSETVAEIDALLPRIEKMPQVEGATVEIQLTSAHAGLEDEVYRHACGSPLCRLAVETSAQQGLVNRTGCTPSVAIRSRAEVPPGSSLTPCLGCARNETDESLEWSRAHTMTSPWRIGHGMLGRVGPERTTEIRQLGPRFRVFGRGVGNLTHIRPG